METSEKTKATADHHHHGHPHSPGAVSPTRLALSATLHCLVGCGIGEIAGTVIGLWLGMSNLNALIIGIVLGFIFGFALGILPLIKAKITFNQAFKQVLIAEGASIAVMETAEALVEVYTPGVMNAGLLAPIFWLGMLLSLGAGFLAAFPINYYLVKKGVRHQH